MKIYSNELLFGFGESSDLIERRLNLLMKLPFYSVDHVNFLRKTKRDKTSMFRPKTRKKRPMSNFENRLEQENFQRQSERSSACSTNYQVELPTDNDEDEPIVFISFLKIEPNPKVFQISSRRRTSSLPSSTVVVDLFRPNFSQRTSSSQNLLSWQFNPEKTIDLNEKNYFSQPICSLNDGRVVLADENQLDFFQLENGFCNEQISFRSMKIDFLGLCFNFWKNELLIGSTNELFVYRFSDRTVRHEIPLPGHPFDLESNRRIRYLSCNSTSIFHGYFQFSTNATSTVVCRLSQYQLRKLSDLEFLDGTLHGLCALETSVGMVIRYGHYSSKPIQYILYVYDPHLNNIYHRFDLKNVGFISGLTVSRRTFDWILSDYKGKRLILVNEESIEYVSFDEEILQCSMIEHLKMFVVWLRNRLVCYKID